ncbi:hypothetical protein JYT20_01555 [Rhodothermus sp. AH-315-K08]|nr:hypothetical protein [Rhodothermus sp. AH-315-K08]
MSEYEFDLELELAINTWRRRYGWSRVISAVDVDELERHLRDHVDYLVDRGKSPEEAFKEVVRELGQTHEAESEYDKVFGASCASTAASQTN